MPKGSVAVFLWLCITNLNTASSQPVATQYCTYGDLRLVDGPVESAGQVEICINGVWGRVCGGYGWDDNEARVVCQQLGYDVNTSFAASQATFTQESDPVFLSYVMCTGNESSLLSCSHPGIGYDYYHHYYYYFHHYYHHCLFYNDAQVVCTSSAQNCTNETIRLVDGPVESAGRVEICINGVWGTVCDYGWDNNDARVVCRQLGYDVNNSVAVRQAAFGQGIGFVLLSYVGCTGSESSLLSCSHGIGVTYCSHYQDAGVVCPTSAPSCTNQTLRLVNGPVESAGRVEICINGVWGTVCDSGWDSLDAGVVCRELGYMGGAIAVIRAAFGRGTGPIVLTSVDCNGTESSLLSCSHQVFGATYCLHSNDAGVVCPSSVQNCTNGTLRLVDGPLESAGRVEICINGLWGTVCNSGWDNNDAMVVCRQLGYSVNPGRAIAVFQAAFGQGTGPVFLSNVRCTGNEYSLLSCSHSGIGVTYCSHYNGAGVVCPSSTSSCTNETLRLVDGPVESAGRVEICINGVWGTVCALRLYDWNNNNARVVCRQLGYNVDTNEAIAVSQAAFGQGTGPVFLSNVRCTGNDYSLLSCNHSEIGVTYCSHYYDAGVVCPSSVQNCTNGTVRLVDGPVESTGRVEICINGLWGTVCNSYWDNNDAMVVCSQLGYSVNPGRAIAVFQAAFGGGTGPIFLSNVRCTGNESSLLSCNHSEIGVTYCSHSSDAGVICPSPAHNCNNETLRLVDGPLESAGRVEICISGLWGTVCNSGWDNNDAMVVCRQLGYSVNPGRALAVNYAVFGQGTGLVLLSNVRCTGNESSLMSCSHGGSVQYCSHSGVICPSSTLGSCTNETLRLVNGSLESAGRVEVCINGVWGTVCSYGWDSNDARVVCRQLGYGVNTGGAIAVFHAAFGQGTGPVLLRDVRCIGNEYSLLSCSHSEIVNYCSHYNDAGVLCTPSTSSCTNETLRLVDGPVESAGRVEICINGVWGTVCGWHYYDWDNNDAKVVCRQLGYNVDTNETIAVFQAAFGQGTGPIFLSNVGCTGTESSLLNCSHSEIGVTYCSHYEDAGVVCPPLICQLNPCANGGTCSAQDTTNYTCTCAPGFTGTNCSLDIDFCTPSTCLVGGTCVEEYGPATSCICSEGFTGTRCDIDIPFCEVDTCLNGGTCHEGFGRMTTCDCAPGFTGTNCSLDLNFCTPSTCLNGGTCIEGYGTVTSCNCTKEFSGPNCTTCVAVPPSSPLITGGGTISESASVTITCESTGLPAPRIIWLKKNGTELRDLSLFTSIRRSRITIETSAPTVWDSCELHSSSSLTIDSVTAEDNGMYVCEVENGLPPNQMNSTNISVIVQDDCETEPCQHGGICTDLLWNVYCNCTGTGYTGNLCQEEIDIKRTETRPVILHSPANTTKPLFASVNLTCVADGYPLPVFQWYRDGLLIPNAVQAFYYIDQVTPDLRGYYTCEAMNSQGAVTSNPGLVAISNVFQYLTDVDVNTTIDDDLISEITSAIYRAQNETSTVRVYAVNLIQTSNATAQLLVTAVTNHSSADIQGILTQQFQSISSALGIGVPITVFNMERYDGCEAIEDDPLNSNFPSLTLTWPESNIGSTHFFPCPCLDYFGMGSSQPMVTRTCGGNFISKARWQPVDYSSCGFTDITFKLCETQLLLRTSPKQAAENLANITSNTVEIHAVDVSVATSIIENLTTAAIRNEEVREGYLQTIDNLVQTDATVIAMSQINTQSSTRLLDSLTNFTDNLAIPNSTTVTFTQKTYALRMNDINASNFEGQTLSVNLGSVQEAMSSSSNIREEAIETFSGNKAYQNRTASVQVPESVFQDLGQRNGQQRLSYSVFVRDTLFQSSDENQSNLTVGSIIVAVRVNGTTRDGNLSTPITVTFQASELVDNATSVFCSHWDPLANGARGVWVTDSCYQNYTSAGLTPTSQSPENSVEMEAPPTVPNFTAQYSQPGHFGLLMDLTEGYVTPLPRVYGVVLQGFSYVGLVISLVCLTAFIITHLASKNLRKKEHEQILINLCFALMGMYLVFILGANTASSSVLCGISAGLLQYFMLVFFSWTAVEAFYLYRKLVTVLGVKEISCLVLKIGLIVWLVPILIVVLCAGPGYKFYYQESKSGFCRSRGLPFYIGLIVPFALLYAFNLIMFVLIMVSICKHSYRKVGSTTEKNTLTFVRKNATIAISLAILFGLGWGFGLAASGTPSKDATFTLQLLFTIFVGCQGLFIFVLHGIRKAEARNEWKRWFSTLTSRLPYGQFSGNAKLDPTVSPFKSHATFSSGSKYISKTGTLPTEISFEMYSNKFAAEKTTAGADSSTAKDADK